jgi:hypothetical protein
VAAHVDEASAELVRCAFEPLAPERCARLLHGERGFWVARYINPVDPPPGYGMFPHVQLEVLEARAQAATARPSSAISASTPAAI